MGHPLARHVIAWISVPTFIPAPQLDSDQGYNLISNTLEAMGDKARMAVGCGGPQIAPAAKA